jgi:hypothetical protein
MWNETRSFSICLLIAAFRVVVSLVDSLVITWFFSDCWSSGRESTVSDVEGFGNLSGISSELTVGV